MNPAPLQTPDGSHRTTLRERVLDATRRAAHLPREAKHLTSMAAEAVEDGVHTAKRALKTVKRGVERLDDLKDDATYRIKREPWKAVAIAAGAGLAVGTLVGWFGARIGRSGRRGRPTGPIA